MNGRSALVFAALATVSPAAHAASRIPEAAPVVAETQPFSEPFHVEGRLGGGTSVGIIGVVAEWNAADVLALGVGVGTNGWLVLGAGARLRWPLWRSTKYQHAFTLEAAYSHSKYEGGLNLMPMCLHSEGCNVRLLPETAHWFQAELGWELRTRSGFTLRLAAGAAWLLNSIEWRCADGDQRVPCYGKSGETSLPVTVVALGYAF